VERRSASLANRALLSSCARRSSRVMLSRRSFEIAQRVADLRRLFRNPPAHGVVERVFEFFPLRERAFGVDFPQPRFQRGNLAALFHQILTCMLAIEIPDFIEPVFDDFDGFLMLFAAQRPACPSPGCASSTIADRIAAATRRVRRFSVFVDETEHLQVALRVAYHAGIIFQLKQADVAVVYWMPPAAVFAQSSAFRAKPSSLRSVRAPVSFQPGPVMLEQRFAAEGPFAVGPARGHSSGATRGPRAIGFFSAPSFALNFPDRDLPRLVVPLLQEVRDVEIHALQYGRRFAPSQRAKRRRRNLVFSTGSGNIGPCSPWSR